MANSRLRVIDSGATEAGSSGFEAYLRCPKEYQLQRIRGVMPVPRLHAPSAALLIGTFFHAARAAWVAYDRSSANGEKWRSAGAAAAEKHIRDGEDPAAVSQALTFSTDLFEQYVRWATLRPAWQPVVVEGKLGPAPFVLDDPRPLWRTARLDLVAKLPSLPGLWWSEAKTTSSEPSAVVEQYTLHTQILWGLALWRTAPQGEARHGPLRGVQLDIAQKGYGGRAAKFSRHIITVPPAALDWFVRDIRRHLRAANRMTPTSAAIRNPASCTRFHGRHRVACPYRPLCALGSLGVHRYTVGEEMKGIKWWT